MTARTGEDMKKTFKLPMLPGQTCGEELLRSNFRKTQALSGTGEKSLVVKPVPADFDFDSSAVPATGSVGRSTRGSKNATMSITQVQPGELEKKVLRFFGFFDEGVTESSVEKSRVRKVTLCYFLEDDTISVSEPRQDNSGIVQGGFVKRHQIERPNGNGTVSFQELAVGEPVSFYGRTYYLVDCDAFTREFMAKMGFDMAPPVPVPSDQFTETRKPKAKISVPTMMSSTNSAGAKVKLSATEVRSAQQFFEKDRKVLRYKAVWDDRRSLYGEKHYFTLYYFLADDTIELVEDSATNSGRDPFPSFCRRQKIVKPGSAKATGGLTFGQKELNADADSYTESDLRIGVTAHIFGRDFLIYDYDKYTREHLKQHHGITEYAPLKVSEAGKAAVRREPPPYNGYGSEEDSLSSWRSLDLKPPRKNQEDYNKFGEASVKYSLRLVNGNPNDENRRFVLSCFLADTSIAIFEMVQRNSGILGGKFLQRQKVKNHNADAPNGSYFGARDFYVGQKVQINKFDFEVIGTDERSLAFMEENSGSFPKSNINLLVSKLQAMLLSSLTGLEQAMLAADKDGKPVNVETLTAIFKTVGDGEQLCEQEAMTLLRFFERNGDVNLNFEILSRRLLDLDETPSSDDRPWEVIQVERSRTQEPGTSIRERVDAKIRKIDATTAAYAARTFLEAYNSRRQLFHTEFKFITDYAVDNLIGENEFRRVVTEKLGLNLTNGQVDALAAKVFPTGARRVSLEEFLRILNNTSNYDHNVGQIKSRRE